MEFKKMIQIFFFNGILQDFFVILLSIRNLFNFLISSSSIKACKKIKVYRILFHVYRALNHELSLDTFRIISTNLFWDVLFSWSQKCRIWRCRTFETS